MLNVIRSTNFSIGVLDCYTMEPLLKDTPEIRTPLYKGHLSIKDTNSFINAWCPV